MTISNIEFKNCILDEVHIRQKVSDIDISTAKETWQLDTYLLAKFLNNFEAGNVDNEGLLITSFRIKRRNLGELNSITLAEIPYDPESTQTLIYYDYTAPVGDLVYSIEPVGENELPAKPNEVIHESLFTGVWLVDKTDNFTFGFWMQLGNGLSNLNVALQQKRIEIDTFDDYPGVYYFPGEHHRFTVSALVNPTDYSITEWRRIINKITQHVPLIVKSGSGDIYVCDVHSPQKSTWLINAYRKKDPVIITVECVEIMSYESYMEG